MAPLDFINPLDYQSPFSRWRGRRQNKSKESTKQKRNGKQARSTSSLLTLHTTACITPLESIPEQALDNEEHEQNDSNIHKEPDTNSIEPDTNNSAVVTTAIDYKSVLSQWKGRNNEPEVARKPRVSTNNLIDLSNNNKATSRLSVPDVTPPSDNVPVEALSVTEGLSEHDLPQEWSEPSSSPTRNGSDDTLPIIPKSVQDDTSPIIPKSVQDDEAIQKEVLKIEPSVTSPNQPKSVQFDQSIQKEVLKIEPSVTSSTKPKSVKFDQAIQKVSMSEPSVSLETAHPSQVSGVDEGCNMPLHPAEQSIMVMLLKPTASTPLGIQLTCYGWRIVITHIEETSLLFHSELQIGQTILAVNGMAASDFGSAQAILDALQVSRKVVIVATKSILFSTTEAAGLVVGKTSWNTLYISQVLVPNSTLRTGMTLIAMNRTTDLDLRTANRILQEHQMGQTVRLSVLALPTAPESSEASSSMTLYLDETCVTAQLLPSCAVEFRKHDDWRITIASIQNHPKLRVGQTILAVNGVPAHCFGSAEAMKEMVSWSPALVFATNSILVSVIKPNADTKVGIAFELCRETLRIHEVDPEGLFHGKLKQGMKVIAINGNPCPRSLETANVLVKDCVGKLTIVAVDDEK